MSNKKLKIIAKRKLVRKSIYVAILLKLFLMTGSIFKEDVSGFVDGFKGVYAKETTANKIQNNVESSINDLIDRGAIYVVELQNTENEYYFEDKHLCIGNEVITLKDFDGPIYLMSCNIDDETFENIELRESKTEELCLNYSIIDNNFINYLPDTVKVLGLSNCSFITDLSKLPKQCPNIEELYIARMPSLGTLDFIYQLPNLKKLSVIDSAYVTEDLINYLNKKGVEHNLTEVDIANSKKIDDILNKIIKPGMSDHEKIREICLYVLDNVKYRSSQVYESNNNPLTCVLEDGKGVCSSYAYLTNVLLSKAGIKSFEISNHTHGWNMIKLDDNYYYIDTTSIDSVGFYRFILKNYNICGNYIIDVDDDFNSLLSSPREGVIPISLMEDIYMGKSHEEIYNKYISKYNDSLIIAAYVLHFVSMLLFPSMVYLLVKNSYKLKKQIVDYRNLYM